MSKKFNVKTGLRQGDALSPMLYNIALEEVDRKVIKLVEYTDDMVIMQNQ